MQRAKIRETGLEGLVRAAIVSEEVGAAKPDRRIFERALGEIGATAASTLFVGDNPDADILGAKPLGMSTAWVHCGRAWPYDDQLPDHIIGHVSEVRRTVLG